MRQKAILLLITAAILWSSSGLFVKVISWGPMSILSGRGLIVVLVMLLYMRRPQFQWSRFEIIGAFAHLGTQLFFILGTKLTTAANVIFLSFTSPIYLVLFGYWFLGERPKRVDWAAMILIFSGMFLFFGDDMGFDSLLGNTFGVLSGISMAGMAICMRGQKAGNPANSVLLGNAIGLLIGLPWLIQESFTLPSVGIILFLGIFQMGISLIFYSFAIKQLEALETTLITALEPVLNPLWVFLIIGETPGPLAVLGGLIVLGAVLMRSWISTREMALESP